MTTFAKDRLPVDLRSDTLTRPSTAMREIMARAPVGDDAYGEDPSVKELEVYCADLFGKEAALFTCTATMSNQIAVRTLTSPGDEVVLDIRHHINYFESAQTANLAGVALNPVDTADGILTAAHLDRALSVKARSPLYSRTSLICIENTISYHGGRVFPLEALSELFRQTRELSISLYIDGARLLNACVAADRRPAEYARYCDALNVCCTKGLGAPFGSVLVGSAAFVERARRFRKWYGGALHQSGMLAAAALYALRENIAQLRQDHCNARLLAVLLAEDPNISVCPTQVETNIVLFDVANIGVTATEFIEATRQHGVLLLAWTGSIVRAVTHMLVDEDDIRTAAAIIRRVHCQLSQHHAWGKARLAYLTVE